MPYTAEKPQTAPPSSDLRARIPGWGVDLDPKDRPAVPKENFNPQASGAHWTFPEKQREVWPRERSIEHKILPPVFGTSCPPRGLSGAIRYYAYRFSEARPSHWLLLMAADRVNVLESRVEALASGRPDSRLMETGILSEYKYGGVRSRIGQRRADNRHVWIDAIGFAAPYLAVAGAAYLLLRSRKPKPAQWAKSSPRSYPAARPNRPPRDRSGEGISTPS